MYSACIIFELLLLWQPAWTMYTPKLSAQKLGEEDNFRKPKGYGGH